MITESGTDLFKAKFLLESEQLVAIPTETVYGLAGNALNPKALTKIFKAKARPMFDPLIVHIGELDQMMDLAMDIPDSAVRLAETLWPGPLTMVFKKKSMVPDLATSGLNTVGIRMPRHGLTRSLLQSLDFPLAAPSANPFGYISPTSAIHVLDQMNGKIPYILDGGICGVGLESTIIDMSTENPTILRKGGTTVEEIESVIGVVSVHEKSSSNPKAPGMLVSHYAPSIPLKLGNIEEMAKDYKDGDFVVLGHSSLYGFNGLKLSASGDLDEAAKNLFSHLRELDKSNAKIILAELLPNIGLGLAINDRLRRAESRH